MLYTYIVISAAVMLLLNIPFGIFTQTWSIWGIPLIFVGLMLFFIVLHTLILAFNIWIVDLKKPPRDSNFFRFWVKGFLDLALFVLRIKVHTTGLEKIPEDEPFLLVCNHIHDLDPAIIYYTVPDARIAFIGKKEVRDLFPFVYKALHKLSGLPIDRENNREAAKTIINASHLIKEGTNSVAIFPEGYVSKSGELLPMRNGAFKIATKAKCKIVVCTLLGTRQIPKNLLRRKSEVYFDVLDVIDTVDITQTAEIGERVYETMKKSLDTHK